MSNQRTYIGYDERAMSDDPDDCTVLQAGDHLDSLIGELVENYDTFVVYSYISECGVLKDERYETSSYDIEAEGETL